MGFLKKLFSGKVKEMTITIWVSDDLNLLSKGDARGNVERQVALLLNCFNSDPGQIQEEARAMLQSGKGFSVKSIEMSRNESKGGTDITYILKCK